MIKKQTWKPDTCECVVEQYFDYSGEEGVLVENTLISQCQSHTTVDQIIEENVSKNNAITLTAEILGIEAVDIGFSIDEQRNIRIKTPDVLVKEKSDLINEEFTKMSEKLILE